EPIQPGQLLGAVQAKVAEQAPHQVAVLLLHVGVVVAVEGPASAELNLLAAAVVDQSCVQELETVVDVQTPEGEGQLPAELGQVARDGGGAGGEQQGSGLGTR